MTAVGRVVAGLFMFIGVLLTSILWTTLREEDATVAPQEWLLAVGLLIIAITLLWGFAAVLWTICNIAAAAVDRFEYVYEDIEATHIHYLRRYWRQRANRKVSA